MSTDRRFTESSPSAASPLNRPMRAADRPRPPRILLWLSSIAERGNSEPWLRTCLAVAVALACATALRALLDPWLGRQAPYGMFMIAVIFIAWSRGLVPALATVILGITIATYLFVEPRYTFHLNEASNWANLAMTLIIGVSVSLFSESLRVAVAENKRLYQIAREAELRKDEFLATVAHELRNPLAPIRNALYLLENSTMSDPNVNMCRELIGRQIEYLIRLVEDLLDVSRITRGTIVLRIASVPLSEIIERALEVSRGQINEKRQQLNVSIPEQAVAIRVDQFRLTQVIANLLNNASRYTGPGGQIWLTAVRSDSDLVLRVRDTGIGLAAEDVSRIFDPFVQVGGSGQQSPGGLGLGLTLVRHLVEAHGGAVEARSPGRGLGSEFVVRLPGIVCAEVDANRASADALAVDGAQQKPLRVMVVDDNVASATSMAKVLGLWNHDVQIYHDGFAAIEAARTFQPEVVLADIGLPQMTGYQLAHELRMLPGLKSTLLVAVTGFGQPEDVDRAKEAGFDRHLLKPVEPAELAALLANVPAA